MVEAQDAETHQTAPHDKPARGTPWHVWVVAVVALLWSSFGALDYLMTQTRSEAYMSQFTPQQLEFFYGFPSWLIAVWAVAVWGGVLGAILLLLRKRLAVWALLASLVAMVITTVRNYVFADGMAVIGDTFSLVFTAVIFLVALALFLYARALEQRGVLR